MYKRDSKDWEIIGTAATIGALAGFGLTYASFSALITGGIIAAILPALIIGATVYEGKLTIPKYQIAAFSMVVASIAVGVCISAAASFLFPGVMSGMASAALAGAVIGVIAPAAGLFTAETVSNCTTESIIEKVKENVFKS